VIARLHAATQAVLAEPGLRHRREDVVDGKMQSTTPEQARDFVRAGIAKWSAVIRARGITRIDRAAAAWCAWPQARE
jgi:tripartite-type tricarboxylate transporter receptor subunit TctC